MCVYHTKYTTTYYAFHKKSTLIVTTHMCIKVTHAEQVRGRLVLVDTVGGGENVVFIEDGSTAPLLRASCRAQVNSHLNTDVKKK